MAIVVCKPGVRFIGRLEGQPVFVVFIAVGGWRVGSWQVNNTMKALVVHCFLF